MASGAISGIYPETEARLSLSRSRPGERPGDSHRFVCEKLEGLEGLTVLEAQSFALLRLFALRVRRRGAIRQRLIAHRVTSASGPWTHASSRGTGASPFSAAFSPLRYALPTHDMERVMIIIEAMAG